MAKQKPSAVGVGLRKLATRIKKAKSLRDGHLLLRVRGGGNFCIECKKKSVKVTDRLPKGIKPLIEVTGQPDAIASILDGKADPVAQFLRGQFRVRGDIQYLSDLAIELKAIKKAL